MSLEFINRIQKEMDELQSEANTIEEQQVEYASKNDDAVDLNLSNRYGEIVTAISEKKEQQEAAMS